MAADPAEHEVSAARSPESIDRILMGACGAIWLALLAMSVVATVALVRLASGHPSGGERHSSWLLYSIIVVSAVIILGAIPLLMRARRGAAAGAGADDEREGAEAQPRGPVPGADARTEKMRVFGVDPYAERRVDQTRPVSAIPTAVLDRLWLRGTLALVGAMGLALIAVAVATYQLASASDTAAWVALGIAGVITVAMPAVLAFYQRQLSDAVDDAGE